MTRLKHQPLDRHEPPDDEVTLNAKQVSDALLAYCAKEKLIPHGHYPTVFQEVQRSSPLVVRLQFWKTKRS